MKISYYSIASLLTVHFVRAKRWISAVANTLPIETNTFWFSSNSEQLLCIYLFTVSYNLKLVLSHADYFCCLHHCIMLVVNELKNGGFEIRYSFIVWGSCEPDRIPLRAFQTSLRYALTFPSGGSLYSVQRLRHCFQHFSLWYLEILLVNISFRKAVYNFPIWKSKIAHY